MRENQTMIIVRRALWEPLTARAWREAAYAMLSLPMALLGFGVLFATGISGVFSVIFLLSAPLLALMLAIARGYGRTNRWLARRLLRLDVIPPTRTPRGRGVSGFFRYYLGDIVAWRAIAYMTIKIPIGFGEFMIAGFCWGYGLFSLASPLIWPFDNTLQTDDHGHRHKSFIQFGDFYADSWPKVLLVALVGLLILLAAPWLTRGMLLLDRWLLPVLLGPSDSTQRLRELEETRTTALNEAALTLRRIERDLHDGAQARLVALGMRLGRAETRLRAGETTMAEDLLRESREDATEIIRELRELVRGIHPPALDSGLEAALATLAAGASIPTSVTVDLPYRPSASLETMLYFSAAELLTNSGKHSHAAAVAVAVMTDGSTIMLVVTDDGVGGASADGAGSGLRGLAERVRTADGRLDINSPPGGPTTVTVSVPAEPRHSEPTAK
jgi:signal transduction histidine kinase